MDYFEAKAAIRFALSQLAARNGHHEFELLACEFTRRKIASNVVPATGPVSAGGDQGRDFESYRTFLNENLPKEGPFLARAAAGNLIVGACTLERNPFRKIKRDLKTIFSSANKPDHVVYFCEDNLPTARQHALQEHCSTSYGATLDIFDGNRLKDVLADPEVSWIAERYLSIPADSLPRPDFGPRYEQLRSTWLDSQRSPTNYSDFVDIKQGLRTATFSEQAQGDLHRWLALIRMFLDEATWGRLARRARYEISVAELRGNGSLDPALNLYREFLDKTAPDAEVGDISDSAVLVTYGSAARLAHAASLSETEVKEYLARIESIIEHRLTQDITNADRSTLLEAYALLSIVPRLPDSEEARDERMIDRWSVLVDVVKNVPLFPVTRLAQMLDQVADMLGKYTRFRSISADVDALVAETTGKAESGDRARKRAVALFEQGHKLAAIDELQRVKLDWFNAENLRGSIITMRFISDIYETLGLHYAARYYAAGALFLILRDKSDSIKLMLAKTAFQLAGTFYPAGEWLAFLSWISQALSIHDATSADPEDWTKHDDLQRAVAHAAILRAISLKIAPRAIDPIDDLVAMWPLPESEKLAFRKMSEGPPWSGMSEAELIEKLKNEFGVQPLSDLGIQTQLTWCALGVIWTIEHDAAYEERLAALSFAAVLQIVQAELGDTDLVILPSNVSIRLHRADIAVPNASQLPDNTKFAWDITIPSNMADLETASGYVTSVALSILAQASALPIEQFMELIDERMRLGLPVRTFSVRPVDELLAFAQPDGVPLIGLGASSPPILPLVPRCEGELAWKSGPGPSYSKEVAESALRNRYATSLSAIKFTLPRILADRRCANLIRRLRDSGMLDWQILTILANVVAQWQTEQQHGRPTCEADLPAARKHMVDRLYREERPDDPEFFLAELDDDIIERQRYVLALAAFRTWGLEVHGLTPDIAAARRLLEERYGHATDDIEHEDPFPGI